MSSGSFLSPSRVDYISTKASYYNDMTMDSLMKDVARMEGEVVELIISPLSVVAYRKSTCLLIRTKSGEIKYNIGMAMDSLKKDVTRVEGEVVELFIVSVVARVVVTPVAWSPGQFLS